MTQYQAGSTVKITATFADINGTLFDPDTVDSLIIEAPDKTVLNTYTTGLTHESTGIYYKYYTLPESYAYVIAEWNYTHNSIADLVRSKIEVKYV